MADKALLADAPVAASRFLGKLTISRIAQVAEDIAHRSLVINDPADGKYYNADARERALFSGISDSDCDISETGAVLNLLLGGYNDLWDVRVESSTANANANAAFRIFGSNTSDALQQSDVGKVVYAIDGQTLAVADAATNTNRPLPNAPAVGRIVDLIAAGGNGTGHARIKLFSMEEAGQVGNYLPTGMIRAGDPYNGWLSGVAGGQDVEVLRIHLSPMPQLNATSGKAASTDALAASLMATNDWFEISGTNASDEDVTWNTSGGVRLQTDNADGDQIMLFPHQDTRRCYLGAGRLVDDELYLGVIVEAGQTTNTRVKIGLTLTAAIDVGTDADQAFFSFGTDASDALGVTNWNANTSIAGTDAQTSTAVAFAASPVRLEIRVGPDRVPRFYVNGVMKVAGSALTTAKALRPFIGLEGGSTNEPTLDILGPVVFGATLS